MSFPIPLVAHLLRTRGTAEDASLPVHKKAPAFRTAAGADMKTFFLNDVGCRQKKRGREVIRRVVGFNRARPPHATLFWRYAEVLRDAAFRRKGQLGIPIGAKIFQGFAQGCESLEDFISRLRFPGFGLVCETDQLQSKIRLRYEQLL